MKHVVLFSGGAASSYVAYLLTQDKAINKGDIVLLHTPTLSEREDSEKFRLKVARYLKLPMTVWGRGENIWNCIDRNGAIPGNFLPFCTNQLKQQMKEEYYKYLESQNIDWIEYVGYGPDEWKRVQKSTARNEAMGREVRFPLFEQGITSTECKRIIQEEWKIELPSAYEVYAHNNCIPCVKGGKKYFKQVWEHDRDKYYKLAEYEEKYGYTVFKDASLFQLEKRFQDDKDWEDMQFELSDFYPCECWT